MILKRNVGAIGTIGNDSLIMTVMRNFDLSKDTLNFIASRTINVCIRTTYYIQKDWENPQLLNWWKLIQMSQVIFPTTENISVNEDEKL